MIVERQNAGGRVVIVSKDAKLNAVLRSTLSALPVYIPDVDESHSDPLITADSAAALIDIDSVSRQTTGQVLNQSRSCGVPLFVMAGDEAREQALQLVEMGASAYVRKPLALRELRRVLQQGLEQRVLKSELDTTRRELAQVKGLDDLIGAGPEMRGVYELIRKVANLDASVLVTGESGTGKELIARAIHNTGSRANRPFVAVSCGAIPETLIESELFGHENGAFTGSVRSRTGYFEQANDGTLFLDEIGELSPAIQVKLLRVLQQREFHRLGSTRPIPLRARLILATHRDLSAMVNSGQFRQDLFYRINVMNIHAPALRRHREDIPLLTHHFIRKYSEMHRKPVDSIAPEALEVLQTYSWPGNIRELENAVQRALILADGQQIEAADLPEIFYESDLARDQQAPSGTFERRVHEYKVRLATDAVQQCNGNKSLAAEKLSISRAYLYRLLAGENHVAVVEMEPTLVREATAGKDS